MDLNFDLKSSRAESSTMAKGNPDSSRSGKSFGPRSGTWKSDPTDSRPWKMSSKTWTARRSAGSPLGDLSPGGQSLATNNMRRSNSFERIAATGCLPSQWSQTCNLRNNRLNLLNCHVILTTDKWTQTTEDVDDDYSVWHSKTLVPRAPSKLPLVCLNNNVRHHSANERKMTSTVVGSDVMLCDNRMPFHSNGLQASTSRAKAVPGFCQRKTITPSQNNAEGFNQEVEKLVEYTGISCGQDGEMKNVHLQTPDGHRAPVAELLSMGCPDGRMLSGSPIFSDSENHFFRISEDVQNGSPLPPIIPDATFFSTFSVSHSESTGRNLDKCQHQTNVIISPSPVAHKSLRKRQAPESSDIQDRLLSDIRNYPQRELLSPVKMNDASRFNIPSEHSAFCPLLKKYVSKKSLLMLSGTVTDAQ